jgi:hypothetical protein
MLYKLSSEAKDAVDILEPAEAVRAVWYDDVKTVLQTLCDCVTI